ncbi:hypothetical protein AMTR_s00040p00205640 [Amborella trichopoda]|uniref:Uncharacterized protein n=1 Tax=Amborella trichopoda TaxID=13333 RepID=W1PYM9_AMBTC|nr:hypothetical protein AMTR_s00040p00205640 [Amborella trichopoda]
MGTKEQAKNAERSLRISTNTTRKQRKAKQEDKMANTIASSLSSMLFAVKFRPEMEKLHRKV